MELAIHTWMRAEPIERNQFEGDELNGKIVGILGLGNIGISYEKSPPSVFFVFFL